MATLLIALSMMAAQAATPDPCLNENKKSYLSTAELRLDRMERQLDTWKKDSSSTADDTTWRNASDLELSLKDLRGEVDRLRTSCSATWRRETDYLDDKVASTAKDIDRLRLAE